MTQPEPPPSPHHDLLSAETIHNLRTPLTVIRAQSQMVARWLRRLDHPDGEQALARLRMVESMTHAISDQLETLGERTDDQAAGRDKPNG